MKVMSKVGLLFILISAFAPAQLSAQEKGFSESDIYRVIYSGLLKIESFGNIRVAFEGKDAEKIGLKEKDLTDLLKLKFKNNFAGIPYKDQSDKILEIYKNKAIAPTIGNLIIKVWIVGDDYPIAYHIELIAGSFENMNNYKNAVLGYGSKSNVPDTVKKTIGQCVEEFAVIFFKARGEL